MRFSASRYNNCCFCDLQSERIRTFEATMEETCEQHATSEAGRAGLEERFQQAPPTSQTSQTEVDALKLTCQQFTEKLEEYDKEKEKTSKTIAMLEFNNKHNINKVRLRGSWCMIIINMITVSLV